MKTIKFLENTSPLGWSPLGSSISYTWGLKILEEEVGKSHNSIKQLEFYSTAGLGCILLN